MEPPLEQSRCDTPPGVYVLVPNLSSTVETRGRDICSRTISSGGSRKLPGEVVT
jgi:hypothetical protein